MGALGQKLRELRTARSLTIQQVADAVRKTPGYISRVETRDEVPSAELLVEIAQLFNSDPADLLRLAKDAQLGRVERDINVRHEQALELYRKARK